MIISFASQTLYQTTDCVQQIMGVGEVIRAEPLPHSSRTAEVNDCSQILSPPGKGRVWLGQARLVTPDQTSHTRPD